MEYNDVINDIIKGAELIEDTLIYYALRDYGIKWLRPSTIKAVKHCIVIGVIGLPITSTILSNSLGYKHRPSVNSMLAKLGDKNVLELQGYGGKGMRLTYHFNMDFLKSIKMNWSKFNELSTKYTGVTYEPER